MPFLIYGDHQNMGATWVWSIHPHLAWQRTVTMWEAHTATVRVPLASMVLF